MKQLKKKAFRNTATKKFEHKSSFVNFILTKQDQGKKKQKTIHLKRKKANGQISTVNCYQIVERIYLAHTMTD